MSFANSDSFFLQIWMPSLSFSYLIAMARTSSTMLNRSGGICKLVLFKVLENKLSFFKTTYCDVSCWFVINNLHYVNLHFPHIKFIESFYHEQILNFVKCFFCIYWSNYVIFIFHSVVMVYHIDWSRILNHPCIPGINPRWSWCMITKSLFRIVPVHLLIVSFRWGLKYFCTVTVSIIDSINNAKTKTS